MDSPPIYEGILIQRPNDDAYPHDQTMAGKGLTSDTIPIGKRQNKKQKSFGKLLDYQPHVPGAPLKGPTMSDVIQPP
jgi:hypothetical protein